MPKSGNKASDSPATKHPLLRFWGWIAGAILFLTIFLSALIPSWQQASAIRRVEELGGRVQTQPGWLSKNLPEEFLTWSKRRFGRKWLNRFDTVTWVILDNTKATDDDLIPLKRFSELRNFYAAGAKISDKGLAHLEDFENLQTLWVYGNRKITDEGLMHVNALTQLRKVNLGYTATTHIGVARFRIAHPNCEVMVKHLE